ncbi:OB-fold-containig protein [Sulfitobacter sp. R18_1]|uniref:OB-fold-containig protein n=1 Tax=Sulfitobacter sp. R18_1 TaxID=2821104 RepID=UPI001ADCD1B1|nr:OB-fold-containig protein [Sulfitobacter sp. R18_1]MBO9428252.1 DUF1449 family protein [Sulfitobacter sp. R18_1]
MDFFLQDGMGPFTFAGTLVIGFVLLEVLFMLMGITTQIGDADAGLDMDASMDASMGDMPDLEVDIPDGVEIVNESPEMSGSSSGGILDILGMRKLPLTVWLALFSAFFAGLGIALQSFIDGFVGFVLPSEIAMAIVTTPALFMTRLFAETIGNWIPQMETTAVSERSFGRRKGVITVGTARRGNPAQVRVTDQHGNLHYLMVEPLSDDEIPEGSDVLIVRVRDKNEPKMVYRLVPA